MLTFVCKCDAKNGQDNYNKITNQICQCHGFNTQQIRFWKQKLDCFANELLLLYKINKKNFLNPL